MVMVKNILTCVVNIQSIYNQMAQFNWKGTWIPNIPYNSNVVVIWDNVCYISLNFVVATDVNPYLDTDNWDVIVVN
jgi:hypothetical protein